jgi:hypothetical protein
MMAGRRISLLDRMEEVAEALEAASEHSDGLDEVQSSDGTLPISEELVPYDDDEDDDDAVNYDLSSDNEFETMFDVIEEDEEGDDADDAPLGLIGHYPVDMGYEDQGTDDRAVRQVNHRPLGEHLSSKRSSVNIRRISTESEETSRSAPTPTTMSGGLNIEGQAQRRVTIHGKSPDNNGAQDGPPLSPSKRRRFKADDSRRSSFVSAEVEADGSKKLLSFVNRRKSRSSGSSNRWSSQTNVADAVEKLRSSQSTDFAHVAAAVAVVASTPRTFVQFGQGDHVLVMLTLLGLADKDGDKKAYTVDPVNAHGFPQGEGTTDAQRHGPYLYVLCTVTQVHFDEDERYYTVRRYDTDTEQRADPSYMEPIRDLDALEAAMRASKRTESSMADQEKPTTGQLDCCATCIVACTKGIVHILRCVIPAYINSRNATKTFLKQFIHGEHGFALNLSFTGVNFLVICSLIFLFHDVIALAFLSSDWDRAVGVVGV